MLYADLQAALGLTLHRPTYPADNNATEKHEIRLKTLQTLYTSFFGGQPLDSPSLSQQSNTTTATLTTRSKHGNYGSQDEERIVFHIVNSERDEITLTGTPTTTISRVLEVYGVKTGLRSSSIRLMHGGTKLIPGEQLSYYEIKTGDVIHAMREQNGC